MCQNWLFETISNDCHCCLNLLLQSSCKSCTKMLKIILWGIFLEILGKGPRWQSEQQRSGDHGQRPCAEIRYLYKDLVQGWCAGWLHQYPYEVIYRYCAGDPVWSSLFIFADSFGMFGVSTPFTKPLFGPHFGNRIDLFTRKEQSWKLQCSPHWLA